MSSENFGNQIVISIFISEGHGIGDSKTNMRFWRV